MFETYDAFIHIDVKTISDSNWSDYKGKLVVEPNQTSYPIDNMGVKANLPQFYSRIYNENGVSYYKPCLTYFEPFAQISFCLLNKTYVNLY